VAGFRPLCFGCDVPLHCNRAFQQDEVRPSANDSDTFPHPLLIVYVTGVLELLGAAGLMLPQVHRFGGICLIALLVGMFVANVNAVQKGIRGKPATPLWLRAPMQVLFVALLWWSTRG
jgi:uncharacterized membrane protein